LWAILLQGLLWSGSAAAQQAEATTPQGNSAALPVNADTTAAGAAEGSRATDPSPLNPEANEFPSAPVAKPPNDFDRLLAEIASLRSRVSALMTSLFRSKLVVTVENDSEEARVVGLVVTLDGGVIYSTDTWVSDEAKGVYEHSVAPGHHVLGIQIERVDSRGKQYRTWQSSRFSIVVPDKKRVEANFYLEDDSDMASAFPSSEAGGYSLQVDLFARVVE
jgi:hypothetical protein